VTQPVLRLIACVGFVAADLLIGGGIASADSGLGGLGIGHHKNNDHDKPRNEVDPISPPIVRIGARQDRGGFEVGPGGIRISRQPGFRGGFDISPGGPRLTIDRRGISGAVNLGPSGSRLKFGRGARAEAEFSPSATTFESEEVGAKVARQPQASAVPRWPSG
jgi:hypothetical protein